MQENASKSEFFDFNIKILTIYFQVLLAKITGRETYKMQLNQFMNWLIESSYRTPKGLVWLDEDAPNRHAGKLIFKVNIF